MCHHHRTRFSQAPLRCQPFSPNMQSIFKRCATVRMHFSSKPLLFGLHPTTAVIAKTNLCSVDRSIMVRSIPDRPTNPKQNHTHWIWITAACTVVVRAVGFVFGVLLLNSQHSTAGAINLVTQIPEAPILGFWTAVQTTSMQQPAQRWDP